MAEQIIRVSHLSKIYRTGDIEVRAINDVSFTVDRGDFVAIMGPSGSGKSTLMHILGALDIASSGEYFLDGQKIADFTEDELAEIRNRKIGFVFQAYNLLPRTTALRNVMVPMIYGGIPKQERMQKAKRFLEIVGLGDRITHTSNQLSGGQQQRVAIARALSMNPSIILADEPTGNIATDQAEEIMKIFTDLNKEGNTVIMITHEPEIAQYAKRVVHVRDGRIIDDHRNGKRLKELRKQ